MTDTQGPLKPSPLQDLQRTLKTSAITPHKPVPLPQHIHRVLVDTRGSQFLTLQDLENAQMDI